MSDYDPDNPQTPMDQWWERYKRRFLPLLLIAIPVAFSFYVYLLKATFGVIPDWIWVVGGISVIIVFIGVATLMDEVNRGKGGD